MFKRFPFLLAASMFLLTCACVFLQLCESQEMAGYDWLMRSRPQQAVDQRICIIEIADDTLKQLGAWPLPRQYHSTLIKALHTAGAKLIVFDVLLSEPNPADELLGLSMQEAGNVLLPYAFDLQPQADGQNALATGMLGTIARDLQGKALATGHINIFADKDGKIRRLPLYVTHGQTNYAYLGLTAAAYALGEPVEDIGRRIPLEKRTTLWINYPGAWTRTFRHYSYLDVLKAYSAVQKNQQAWLDLSVFKDAVCFVGLTATGTSDFRANPLEPVYPMTGTVASVCNSVLRNSFITRPDAWIRLLTALVIIAASIALCLALTPLIALCAVAAVCALYTALCWMLASAFGIAPDIFLPCAGAAAVFIAVLVRKFLLETQKRAALEKELEIAAQIQRSFLPPDTQTFGRASLRALLRPARTVGGDFYDFLRINETSVGIFVGDVCGKGISAALIMAQSISLVRSLSQRFSDPAALLAALNNELCSLLKGRFVTGQYIVIHSDTGTWEAASAGHPALLEVAAAGSAVSAAREKVPASGPPLGLASGMHYVTVRQSFSAGDTLLLYTDGWTECRNRGNEEFGLARLQAAFAKTSAQSDPAAIMNALEKEKQRFEDGALMHDDLTAVVVRFGA